MVARGVQFCPGHANLRHGPIPNCVDKERSGMQSWKNEGRRRIICVAPSNFIYIAALPDKIDVAWFAETEVNGTSDLKQL